VIEGPGLVSEVSSLGAYCLSADTEVSVSDFEAAIRSTNRTNVILLPSAANNHAAAAIAAHNLRAESINVGVISTRSMPQSLAALAVFDADATHYRNLESMKSAFQSTRTGLVLKTHAGVIEGYIDGELIAASASTIPDDMLVHLVDLLLDEGGELVTVIVGEHGEMIQIQLMADHVGIQFDIINGGQHSSIYLIGVE
jgi:dihydroxyacetone kinase-like predicted kinase